MARTQSADYAIRREAIVDRAAELFAERGFLGASIADLADALKTSKSLIYHYYDSKEDILFDVMHSHVKALLDAYTLEKGLMEIEYELANRPDWIRIPLHGVLEQLQ